MTKVNQLLLQDYIIDSTDMNLSLFVKSINSNFNLNKANKKELESLITKYKVDAANKKIRLQSIESYLMVSNMATPQKNTIVTTKPKQDKIDITKLNVQKRHLGTKTVTPIYDDKFQKIGEKISEDTKDKEEFVEYTGEELNKISDLHLFKVLFGDYENDVNSIGWKILNNKFSYGYVQNGMDPAILIEKVFRHLSKPNIQYQSRMEVKNGTIFWVFAPNGNLPAAPENKTVFIG